MSHKKDRAVKRIEWREEVEKLMYQDKVSINKTTEIIRQKYFPELEFSQVRDNKVRGHLRNHCPVYIEAHKKPEQKEQIIQPVFPRPVGVFGDPHMPFDHPNYLQFLIDTFKQYNVGQIICMGDIADNHAISRHQTETCAKSPYDELDLTIKRAAEYAKAFPHVKVCKGNHDEIPVRQAATLGIGKRYLKSLNQLLELPDTWEFAEEYIIDNVLYKHGINCLGKDGALNAAITERMSTVIGHSHAFGGVKYSANKRSIIFGMNAGCGIDVSAYAFAYGEHAKYRPTLGCGIVFNDSYAIFIPMPLSYFRD